MARKTITITISGDAAKNRDLGKQFEATEMPALQAEKWATRAFLAIAKGGISIPEDVMKSGLAGIATLGLKALSGLAYEDAEPLLAEMLACVQIIPDPGTPNVKRKIFDGDIEEVSTLLTLRREVFALHTGFFTPDAP